MKRYPRSFLQLVSLGHVLVALPLLVVTVYVFITLESLSEQYRGSVQDGAQSSQLSSELKEDLLHMERNLRRYEVLRSEETLGDYTQVRREWREHVEAYSRLDLIPRELRQELGAQLEIEAGAYAALRDADNTQSLHSVIDELKLRSAKVVEQVDGILEARQTQFLAESDKLRQRILIAAAIAVSVAVFCLWLIRGLLGRLIGRFERAVVRLGKGDLQQAIALDGPGDLRWLGRWLDWLRRRLLSLEESRAQVLRHVSHELKTPLAAMHEGASLLAEEVSGPLTEEQGRIVGIIQNNSRRLQGLIEGLLRLQLAGHAAERIGHEKLRFDSLTEEVLETYRLIAGERRIRFACSLAAIEVVAGREALVTIVHNLLSNAVKYSPDDGCITIKLQRNGNRVCLDVLDQGPGVDAQDVAHIFEPFYRSAASRQVPGIGLGLAIAREFVLALRGELSLQPSTKGAHFSVLLPVDAPYLRAQTLV